MVDNRGYPRVLICIICISLFLLLMESDAFGRVGGGRTSGSRGSRSSTAPRSYSTPKSAQPQIGATSGYASGQQSYQQPYQQPRSSLWRGIAGGILGGMLFRSLGFGDEGSAAASGIGLFDILLVGLVLYGAYRFFAKRRRTSLADGYDQNLVEPVDPTFRSSQAVASGLQTAEDPDLEKGLSHIRQMDPSFDKRGFRELCTDHFFKIQGAWGNRDMSLVRSLLSDEMYGILSQDAEKLRRERRINRVENVAVRSVDLVEVWQESGQDYITVKFLANLLDYTIDEKTAHLVSGSKTEPVKFEECWTFTRPVGDHPWRLAAIQQTE